MGVVLHLTTLGPLGVQVVPDEVAIVRWVAANLQRGRECRPEVQP